MPDVSFLGLLLVVLAGFAAPLALGLLPRLALPAVVLEIVIGIVIGPSGLGWVESDAPIEILALVGLAFLLFLAGLEVDLEKLKGRTLGLALASFLASFAIAVVVGLALGAGGLVDSPLLVATILVSTSLGVVIAALKDAGHGHSPFGQLVLAAASIADVGAILLLSLFFSRESTGAGAKVVLLGGFAVLALAVVLALRRAEHSMGLSDLLVRLQDTTAQIRVRGAFALLLVFVVLAERLGVEAILGAFVAGAILSLIDRDRGMTHPEFRLKLSAIGFGVFIPVFFVNSGLEFDLAALFASSATVALVPLFLAALLLVRGLPALLYLKVASAREMASAGLLQATSLPFIVTGAQIGMELSLISRAVGAALVGAGLLSVLIFPLAALALLRGGAPAPGAPAGPDEAGAERTPHRTPQQPTEALR